MAFKAKYDATKHVHGDIALRKKSINYKAISRKDGFFITKIEHNEVFMHATNSKQLFAELGVLCKVQIDPFWNVR